MRTGQDVVSRSPDRDIGADRRSPLCFLLHAIKLHHAYNMEAYRITDDTSVYFVTYTVVEWLPVFVSETAFKIVTCSLNFCHESKGLRINAYVIMPTHLHAIVFHESYDGNALDTTLSEFRRFTGRSLADYCGQSMPKAFNKVLRSAAGDDRARRFWQPTRHPVAITSERFYRQKLDYLHANPCRKGLVLYPEEWRFSSARVHAGGGDGFLDVPITPLGW